MNRRVSVANLGRKNPLIPGQQLYGRMIPRPEYDEKIHQFERSVAEQKMRSFKDCVEHINALDGLSEFERRQLITQEVMAGTPMSIGYEVVPLEIAESTSTETDEISEPSVPVRTLLRSVSIKLMSDKPAYVDQREAKNLIVESDGKSAYCTSERCDKVEEEIEVVHMDGLGGISEDDDGIEHTHEESPCSANIPISLATDIHLSRVMGCNEDIQDVICAPSISASFFGPQKRKTE